MIEILLRRVSNYDHSFICGDRSLQEEIHAVTQESLQVDKDQLEKEVRQLNKQISQLQVFKCISKSNLMIINYTDFASYQTVWYSS